MGDRDIHFFDAMLKTLQQDYKVDAQRIYATGHSNGGGFTYLLWAMRGDVFAAVAPSSAVAARYANLLKPKPALHIMGEKDPLVKPEWQKAICDRVLKINGCSSAINESYGAQYATLYPSATNTPTVLYVHPGGYVYPQEANAVVIKFFKSMVKP
jgi:polyhydroxybutyrate depolymerase